MSQDDPSFIPAPDDHDRILGLAALFQGPFNIDWVVALSDARVSSILAALEEGIARGWLEHQQSQFYRFADEKNRRSLRGRFPAPEQEGLNRRIAELLVTELPDGQDKARTLSQYLLQVNNDLDGCRWLVRAGDHHRRAFETEKALGAYSKAVDDLSDLTGDEADRLFTAAAVNYSKISTARHDTRRVVSILQAAMDRSQKLDDLGSQALLEMHMAKNEWLRSHYTLALDHFERGWAMAKDLDDPRIMRAATTFSTFFHYWQGRFKEAVASYERSVPDVEQVPQGRFNLFGALTVGVCYAQIGQVTQGLGLMNAIRSHCEEVGDHYLAAQAVCAVGPALLDIHRPEEALPYLEDSFQKAGRHRNEWIRIMCKLMLAYNHFLLKDNQRAAAYLRQFLQDSRRVHVTVQPYTYLMTLCWAMEEGTFPKIPGLTLQGEIQRMLTGQNVFMKGVAHRYQALLFLKTEQPAHRALDSLNLSLRWLERSGNQTEIARTHMELARQYLAQAMPQAAERHTRAVVKILSSFNQEFIPEDLRHLFKSHLEGDRLLEEILKLSQEVVTLREHKDVVQHIFSAVNRITGAERGAILFFEDKAQPAKLVLRASKNFAAEEIDRPDFAEPRRMIEEVARSGRGRVMELGPPFSAGSPSGQVIHSCIGVPMILRDKVVGVLYHDNRLLRSAFKESDLERLAYFASQAAIAMDNAKAYEEINRLNRKLTEEKHYYQEENLANLEFDDFVGQSPAIRQVLAQIKQVAGTDTTVLILGETGVGKELVARAIHRLSLRQAKPFVRVLCNTLPDGLISSELFGHERGAFTGATQRRIGRFELADGGTIFLDEIGELPRDVQVRLLRVLQNKEFQRVGGARTLRSDFRLVTATNRDLDQEVKAGRLRMDLYYRLNVFPIYVPPLRKRSEDIPLLARHFLRSYATKMGKTFDGIPQEEIDALLRYDWPGNVRELKNVIERATILCPGPRFRIPEQLANLSALTAAAAEPSLRAVERRHVLWALNKVGWKVRGPGGAAELLDLHPSTLAYRLKKLGIQRPPRQSS